MIFERTKSQKGENVKLHSTLGIASGDVVAFAGAGGKSGAIVTIAGELAEAGVKVIVAPTTKMLVAEAERVGPILTSEDVEELCEQVGEALEDGGAAVAGSALISKERVGGVEPEWVPSLAALADVVIVEADGARRRLLKGTAAHEPLLPEGVTMIVAVGNVSVLGQALDEERVHRPELLSKLTGIGFGHSVTAEAMALALARGSLGHAPDGARRAALLTGVEPGQIMSDASLVARELWRLGVQEVVLCLLPEKGSAQVWVP